MNRSAPMTKPIVAATPFAASGSSIVRSDRSSEAALKGRVGSWCGERMPQRPKARKIGSASRPHGVNSYTWTDAGGGHLRRATTPVASRPSRRCVRMLALMPGRLARRSPNRFGAEHQLANDEERPALAEQLERMRRGTRILVPAVFSYLF